MSERVVGEHFDIAFYLPKRGGTFHLPYWGTAISEDHAACRLSTKIRTGINDHRLYATLAQIRVGKQTPSICKRCAQIAVDRADGGEW